MVYFGPQFGRAVHHDGEVVVVGIQGSGSHCIHRQEVDGHESPCSAYCFLSLKSVTLTHGMILPIVKVGLLNFL